MDGSSNIDIKRDFGPELSEISYKLQQLEDGRIYEKTGARMDGTLNTNTKELRKLLNDLLLKIEGKRPSTDDLLATFFM